MGCPSFQQWRPVAALFVVHFFRILISRGVSRFFSFLFLLFVFPSAIFILPFFSLFKLSSSFLSLSLCRRGILCRRYVKAHSEWRDIFSPLPPLLRSLLCESDWRLHWANRHGSIEDHNDRDPPCKLNDRMIRFFSFSFLFFFFIFRGECKRSTLLRLWRMVSFDRCHYRCASLKRSGVVKSIHDWMIFFETKNVSQLAIQVYLKKKRKRKEERKGEEKKDNSLVTFSNFDNIPLFNHFMVNFRY